LSIPVIEIPKFRGRFDERLESVGGLGIGWLMSPPTGAGGDERRRRPAVSEPAQRARAVSAAGRIDLGPSPGELNRGATPMFQKPIGRLDAIAESATVALSDKARRLKSQGVDVIDLSAGDPDFDTPPHIIEAACRAMKAGQTHYVSPRGIPELRQALAAKYMVEQGLTYDPATEVMVTAGGKMALYLSVLATTHPGEAVLIPEPAWVSYAPMVQMTGAVAVPVPLSCADGFALTRDSLLTRVTPASRLLLLNSPSNPTGRVLTLPELSAVAEVAQSRNLTVISDEIYEYILFDGNRHVSIAALPGMRERTIVVSGFSKSYAMTGWRLGTVVGPRGLMSAIHKAQQHTVTCAAAFAQYAALTAITGSQACVAQMREAYARRRDKIVAGLNRLPGFRCPLPEGAFYAFPDIRGTGLSSAALSTRMLEQAHVVMTPGTAFGQAGEGFVRICFSCADTEIDRALERMAGLPS